MTEVDVQQEVRDLISQFLVDHSDALTKEAEGAVAPVVVDYLLVMAIQDALAPPGEPWYSVVTSSDVTYHHLGLLTVAKDWLSPCTEADDH